MAVKISGTTVINDSRDLINVTNIYQGTSDGSDTSLIAINGGGGAQNWARGAGVQVYGNEHATTPGLAWLFTGNVTGSELRLSAGGAARLSINGDTGGWAVNGAGNYGTAGQVLTSQGSGAPPGWASVDSVDTTNVLAATAGASVGAVGTYALLGRTTATAMSPGATVAGSSLRYVSAQSTGGDTPTGPSGTWRCMGYHNASSYAGTVFLRIS